jgi:hypothetical protein
MWMSSVFTIHISNFRLATGLRMWNQNAQLFGIGGIIKCRVLLPRKPSSCRSYYDNLQTDVSAVFDLCRHNASTRMHSLCVDRIITRTFVVYEVGKAVERGHVFLSVFEF